MMDRRRFLLVSLAGALGGPVTAGGQPSANVRTIAFFGPPPSAGGLVEAFQRGLHDLGYVEGRNVKIEYRYTDDPLQGNPGRMDQLAAELVRLNPAVLVVSITEAALAAKKATSTIPIVMVSVPDPVAAGLVSSLGRPGGNVTGLTRQTPDLLGKNLQLLKEALPNATLVGVLANPTDPLRAVMVQEVKDAAKSLGVQLNIVEARPPTDLEGAFGTLRTSRVGAVLVLGGGAYYLNRTQIAGLALTNRLPSMFQAREFVEAGGLLSYAPSTTANYRRAAVFVDRILKGAKPGELPVEQPTQFEFVINLKTAKALGLTVPPSLLARADQVIE
jgi:putative ABC transport system substrate-binding protein